MKNFKTLIAYFFIFCFIVFLLFSFFEVLKPTKFSDAYNISKEDLEKVNNK